jgi:hypothetical protein
MELLSMGYLSANGPKRLASGECPIAHCDGWHAEATWPEQFSRAGQRNSSKSEFAA